MTSKEIIKGIKKEGMTFISNHYQEMTKEQLKEIATTFYFQTMEATKHSIIRYDNLAFDDLKMFLPDE